MSRHYTTKQRKKPIQKTPLLQFLRVLIFLHFGEMILLVEEARAGERERDREKIKQQRSKKINCEANTMMVFKTKLHFIKLLARKM